MLAGADCTTLVDGWGVGGRTGAGAGLRGWLTIPTTTTVMVLGEATWGAVAVSRVVAVVVAVGVAVVVAVVVAVGVAVVVAVGVVADDVAAAFEPPEVVCADGVGLETTNEDWSACWVACEPMLCAVLTMSSTRPTQTPSMTVPTRIWMAEGVIQ